MKYDEMAYEERVRITDRERLIKILSSLIPERIEINTICGLADCLLDNEVVPVTHAHWMEVDPVFVTGQKACSNCGCCESIFSFNHDAYNYCPHCGAKMDEEEEE